MEKILDTFLDRVRLDAVAKLKNAYTTAKDPQNKVIAAAKEIMKLADIARKNGLLILESMAETTDSDLLRQLILLVVDGTNPDMVVEIGTNFYWTEAPDGADAMAEYMYLRGMLSIQNGDNPRTLDLILASLMPAELHAEYQAQMEVLHQSEEVDKLFHIHPTFQDSEIWESIRDLEETFSRLPNRCIQRVLREIDNMDLAVCIYVIEQDTRKKILANISTALANAIMEDVALCASVSEKEVAARVTKVMHTVSTLQEAGEILVPAPESPLQKN